MTSNPFVFRSRWGFHPYDYETHRKLKFLNLVYWKAIRMEHAWKRWKRKDPKNRVKRHRIRNEKGQTIGYEPPIPLAEPKICPVFSQIVHERRFVDKRGVGIKDGFLEETVVTDDFCIPTDYAAGRKPAPQTADVRPLSNTVTQINELYERALAWIEAQDIG